MPGSSWRHSATGTDWPGRRSACQVRWPSFDEKPKLAYSITQLTRQAGGSSLSFWKTSPSEVTDCS